MVKTTHTHIHTSVVWQLRQKKNRHNLNITRLRQEEFGWKTTTATTGHKQKEHRNDKTTPNAISKCSHSIHFTINFFGLSHSWAQNCVSMCILCIALIYRCNETGVRLLLLETHHKFVENGFLCSCCWLFSILPAFEWRSMRGMWAWIYRIFRNNTDEFYVFHWRNGEYHC